tara:strand:- start:478 stop:1392 length:915 start_codon:yes stop_codon:yes gene_type:complete
VAENINRYRVDPLHIKMTEGKSSAAQGNIGGVMDYLGEIAMSSQFKLNLFLSGTGTDVADNDLNQWFRECGIFGDNANDQALKYDLLCHQAQLPGTQFDLATEKGGFQGITETFARARQFTQFAVSFYVDSEYNVIRLFEEWMNFINPLVTTKGKTINGSPAGSLFRQEAQGSQAYLRMRYPEDYKRNITITKFERNAGFHLGKNSIYPYEQESRLLTYQFVNAFPIQVAAVNLNYGGSEIAKVDIVFNYDRYTTMKHDPGRQVSVPRNLSLESFTQLKGLPGFAIGDFADQDGNLLGGSDKIA